MAWTVLVHPDAEEELNDLPTGERVAVDTVIDKLCAVGPRLTFPHSSNVQTADNLRELRPRQGRCRWRAFYRQIGNAFVVGSIGPEASVDPRGFRRCVIVAEKRLDELEED
jgi:hypothetical protein